MTAHKRESFLSSMQSSAFWRSLKRLTGVLKHIIVAATIGLTAQLDVFYMLMALLGIIIFSWSQVLEVVAVPKLVELSNSHKKDAFVDLSSGLFILCVLFSIFLCILIIPCRSLIAKAAMGFDAERNRLLVNSFLWMTPVFLFYIPYQFIGSVLRSVRRFSLVYQAEFFIGATTLLLIILYKNRPNVLFWSFSTGLLVAFIYLLFFFKSSFKFRGIHLTEDIRQILKAVPGLLLLQTTHHLYILTDRFFVSFLGTGSLSALAYGRAIGFSLESVLNIKSSFITIFAEAQDPNKKSAVYNDMISLAIYLSLPITFFLIGYGDDIIALFLERGMFTNTDTKLVHLAVSGFSLSLLPVMLQAPIEQIFQVQRKIGFIVFRTFLGFITNISLNYLFVFIFEWGIWGIALATSIGQWVVFIFSIAAATKLSLKFRWSRHIAWGAWMGAGSALASYSVLHLSFDFAQQYQVVFQSVILFTVTLLLGVVYFGAEGQLVRNVMRRVVLRHG